MTPNKRYVNPARLRTIVVRDQDSTFKTEGTYLLSRPTVQYQQTKKRELPRIFQGSSIKSCEVTKAVQLYIRLGRSLVS